MEAKYRIIFRGKVLDGTDKKTLENTLAKTLKLSEEHKAQLFSGKKLIIKKNACIEDALKVSNRFLSVGAVVEFVPEHSHQETPQKQPASHSSESSKATLDIWYALKSSCFPHIIISIILWFVSAIAGDETLAMFPTTLLISNLLLLSYTIPVWRSLSKGYIVNLDDNIFSFPASDVENNISDIITFKKLRNMMHRTQVKLTDIRALNNEKGRRPNRTIGAGKNGIPKTKDRWLLNVSGEFGSQQLEFDSKQKRDECRSMLYTACYRKGNRLRGASDFNLDL